MMVYVKRKSKFMKMSEYNRKSQTATAFHAFFTLEERMLPAGYAAFIVRHNLSVPFHAVGVNRLLMQGFRYGKALTKGFAVIKTLIRRILYGD